VSVIAAYILIQTQAGQAAIVAAALRDVPGVWEAASLARLVTSRVQAPGGVRQTMTCPVVHL
jgi:hypothetical protein